MISRWLPLALCVTVFAPGLLHAQPTEPQPRTQDYFSEDNPTNHNKMYEDVEILRRILDRKLTPLYPSETFLNMNGMMMMGGMNPYQGYLRGAADITPANRDYFSPAIELAIIKREEVRRSALQTRRAMIEDAEWEREHTPHPEKLRSLEGVYLKGQGVIYTATLSSLQLPAQAEVAGSAKEALLELARSPSEWESVRRQVRNEKEEPKKAETTKPPELSDVLLRTLMENGHHFSQLGENESLTIVITVRETSPSSSGPKSEEKSSDRSQITIDLATKVRDLELLADLHLKQGQYKEALVEYTKTLELLPSAELHRKLAQCYLGLHQMEIARTEVDRAIEFSKKSQDAKDKPKPVATLPVKLIVSASKKLLDEAKGGKITFVELRSKAHVETLKFDAARR